MKKNKLKKLLIASISCGTLLCSMSTIDTSAVAVILGYYDDGTPVYGGSADTLVGFDENGNAITERDLNSPLITAAADNILDETTLATYIYDEDGNIVKAVNTSGEEYDYKLPYGSLTFHHFDETGRAYYVDFSGNIIPYGTGLTTAAIDYDNTIGDSEDTIGDSVETVGGSDTGIRGDINYDGKVNVSDLIYLRRYLLHLIKW